MTTYTDRDILLSVKSIAFTDELIAKTRDGGLPWTLIGPNLYTVTICQPPRCQIPATPSSGWTYYVTRNNTSDGTYSYYLEVLLDGLSFMTISSRQVDQVETLFGQIQIFQTSLCKRKVRRAIKFMSNIPTSPQTEESDFVMCGGVAAEGESVIQAIYTPAKNTGGVAALGTAPVQVVNKPQASTDGVELGGEASIT